MTFFKHLNKKRKGFTVTEALFCLICVAFVVGAVVSVAAFLRGASASVRAGASIETYVISVAEAISLDIEDGVDITDVDYNEDPRLDSSALHSQISVFWQEDVMGEMLYWVRVDCLHKDTNTNQVATFFLRGGDF